MPLGHARPALYAALILLVSGVLAQGLSLTAAVLDAATLAFGRDARMRLLHWQNVVDKNRNETDLTKLEVANQLVNENRFLDDLTLWDAEDYWATPIELFGVRAGDCEDFTLAEYFTLRAMQIDEEKPRVIYVNALNLEQAHMVLGYYGTPDAEPLVLDNLVRSIKPASMRPDLEPVYTFVGSSLWDAKMRAFAAATPVRFVDVFLLRLDRGAFNAMRARLTPQST